MKAPTQSKCKRYPDCHIALIQALEQGLLGMAFTNGSPYVAPTRYAKNHNFYETNEKMIMIVIMKKVKIDVQECNIFVLNSTHIFGRART